MKYEVLSNGVLVPVIGYGTFRISDEAVEKNVLDALAAGYRHIDTAAAYGNESGIGSALKKSGLKREDLFITTKIRNEDQGYEETLHAFEKSCQDLHVDTVDLLLIHWPNIKSAETWRALEMLYYAKKARAIGVSNFHVQHLDKLLQTASIKPMVNQVERHPYLNQSLLEATCRDYGIALESWSPLAKGRVFKDRVLSEIAQRYGKTISQVVIRWHVQTGWITIPKSVQSNRMIENKDIFDFELSDEDLRMIEALDRQERTGSNPDAFIF